MEVELPAVVFCEGRFYVAFCPVNREALELYYEIEIYFRVEQINFC